MSLTTQQEAFIAAMLPTARKYEAKYGFAAEGLVGINISESGWGSAGSYFGIKGTGNAGGIDYTTWENYGPGAEHTVINDQFAAYKSLDDAYQAFFDFIQIGRYIPAWTEFQRTHDWQQLLRGLVAAGYATDTGWPNLIIQLSNEVRASNAFKAGVNPMANLNADGSQRIVSEGNFVVLYNSNIPVMRWGSTDGRYPGRISKNFGGNWLWQRALNDNAELVPEYWSPDEGD